MNRLVKIGGIFNLVFAAVHLGFWQVLNWPASLHVLSDHDAAIVQVLNSCLIIVFTIFAYLSLFHTREMVATGLGRSALWSIAIFWLLRSVMQSFFLELHVGSAVFLGIYLMGSALFAWSAKNAGNHIHAQA